MAIDRTARRRILQRATSRAVGAWIVLPLFFLATGGSLRWWQAWACCAILLVPMTFFVVYVVGRDPEFLERRLRLKEKETAQRRILAWGYPLLLAAFVIPGLDHRFGWSHPPVSVVVGAMGAALAGYLGILGTFLENRWAGRTIETYEGQQLVSTGLYSVVRHPMYAASVILYIALPLALGSWWAVLPALGFVSVFVFRIRNEEAVLLRDLPGYAEYCRRVKYRLVPLLW